jgi:5'(3')-deoxyribonucleotidase
VIFFDLDDVLADFTGYTNRALGTKLSIGDTMTDENWHELRKYHQRMFADLEVVEPMRNLVSRLFKVVTPSSIAILTALPFDDQSPWQFAPMDKVNWCRTHFPGIPVFFGPYAHSKKLHCSWGDTLIDDKFSNCDGWKAAGGFAHLFRTPKECEEWLHDERHINI